MPSNSLKPSHPQYPHLLSTSLLALVLGLWMILADSHVEVFGWAYMVLSLVLAIVYNLQSREVENILDPDGKFFYPKPNSEDAHKERSP